PIPPLEIQQEIVKILDAIYLFLYANYSL
ncbi:hypothetical protein DDP51_08315, partial [Helicobacter pylori]